jgi:molecular chaperone GrpE
VSEETDTVPDGTVTNELQRGYRIRDRVLRPAMVAVARNSQTPNQNQAHAGNGDFIRGGNN